MKKVKIVKILLMLILVVLAVSNYSLSQQWVVVPSPSPSSTRNILRGVGSISSNDVWAMGVYDEQPSFTLTQHWNGVNWTIISSPNHGVQYNELYAVQGLSSNNVYAVGYYSVVGTPQMLVLHWDGTSWTEQTTPTVTGGSGLESIVIFGPDDIYAGGFKSVGVPGPSIGTLVLHWNGSSWNIETTPNQSDNRHNFITDMKGLSANDIWAVGYSRRITENYQAMVLHKTGSDWNIVPVPQQPGAENFLYSIDIIAPDNIWAAGEYNDGSNYSPYFLHYNGSNWSIVNSAGGGGGIVSNSANDIWSSGSPFAHYDGTTWNVVNTPIPTGGALGTMARISSTDIWAVGRTADGSNLTTLTMHYGSPVPVELTAFEAAVDKNNITLNWATATETNNKGFEVLRMLNGKWKMENGNEEWNAIGFINGSGTTTEVRNYSFEDKNLSAGTYQYRLKQIDFDGSFEYSDIVEVELNNLPTQFSLWQNYPNPFNPTTIIRYHLPAQNQVTIKVYNMLGSEIATLVDEIKEAGVHEIEFTNNGQYSSGIYFYTMQTGNFIDTKKFVMVK